MRHFIEGKEGRVGRGREIRGLIVGRRRFYVDVDGLLLVLGFGLFAHRVGVPAGAAGRRVPVGSLVAAEPLLSHG